jgi:hypothetical protein
MSCNENDCKTILEEVFEEVIEVKKKKRQYLPRDIEYNKKYYHKNVKPATCEICGTVVVNRAMYSHKLSKKCTLVAKCLEIDRLNNKLASVTIN